MSSGCSPAPPLDDQGAGVPYAKRLKVELTVESEETLGDVIHRAADRLGVGVGQPSGARMSDVITGVVFYKPEDEQGLSRPEPWPATIRLLDVAGRP